MIDVWVRSVQFINFLNDLEGCKFGSGVWFGSGEPHDPGSGVFVSDLPGVFWEGDFGGESSGGRDRGGYIGGDRAVGMLLVATLYVGPVSILFWHGGGRFEGVLGVIVDVENPVPFLGGCNDGGKLVEVFVVHFLYNWRGDDFDRGALQ